MQYNAMLSEHDNLTCVKPEIMVNMKTVLRVRMTYMYGSVIWFHQTIPGQNDLEWVSYGFINIDQWV